MVVQDAEHVVVQDAEHVVVQHAASTDVVVVSSTVFQPVASPMKERAMRATTGRKRLMVGYSCESSRGATGARMTRLYSSISLIVAGCASPSVRRAISIALS